MSSGAFNTSVFNAVPFNGSPAESNAGACLEITVARLNTCAVTIALADCGESMSEYAIGNVVRVSGAFTDSDGEAVDPGAITAKVKTPLGVVTTYVYGEDGELVKDSTGNYHVDLEPDKQGKWKVRFAGTGSNKAAAESSFTVTESAFD